MATARSLRADHRGLTPVVALLGVAAVAWPLTAERMAGMDMGPGADPGRLGWFVVTWALMMTAMMLPALVPAARAGGGGNAAFVGGYLGVWTGAGVAAYALVEAVRGADPGWLAWGSAGRWLAAGAILAAAVYQLTGAKGVCLDRCRGSSGAGVAAGAGRRGAAGGMRDGVRHGAACVGCCAGLMAVLFVLGVMSLTWMVAVTALIAAERLLPWRTPAVFGVAAVLAVMAVWIAVDPASVPGLTLPTAPMPMPMGGM